MSPNLITETFTARRRDMVQQSVVRWTVFLAAAVSLSTCAGTGERRSAAVDKRQAPSEGDYADRSSDGSYAFRYADKNQFHTAAANKDNVVSGRYISHNEYITIS